MIANFTRQLGFFIYGGRLILPKHMLNFKIKATGKMCMKLDEISDGDTDGCFPKSD